MSYSARTLCIAAFAFGLILYAAAASAKVLTETVEYQQDDQTLEGMIVYDDAKSGPRPGVVIFHAWYGPGKHEEETAVRLAEQGYAAFVADVYGKGVRANSSKEASELATTYYENRDLMQARALAAVETLRGSGEADPEKMFGIGYCFGGAVVLETARAGADLLGVVSIHGTLRTPHPEAMRNFKGSVLALHGAADPVVPAEEVSAFKDELSKAGVDWIFTSYGGAVHSFTHKSADSDSSRYDPLAAKRAWRDMLAFFEERLEHAGGK